MTVRTIAVALWSYRDAGRRWIAYHGDLVDLAGIDPADVERAERLGVFAPEPDPEPDPAAPGVPSPALGAAEVAAAVDGTAAEVGPEPDVPRPKRTALMDEWVAYAVRRGMDRATAEAASKAELIKALAGD